MVDQTTLNVSGFLILKGALDRSEQESLRDDVREVVRAAPLRAYQTPGGRQMSVRMSAAGGLGWTSDRSGYSYRPQHQDGQAWPEMPQILLKLWERFAEHPDPPNSCLVNYYGEGARMSLHRDDTEGEAAFSAPVLSVSLGDDGLFRMGGLARNDPTTSHWLQSGDVVVMAGAARLAYHGIDRIRFGSSTLLAQGGRINLTLRVALP